MRIYHVDAQDLMNSTMSNDRYTIGYFSRPQTAEQERDRYNRSLSQHLKNSTFAARITEIEVDER